MKLFTVGEILVLKIDEIRVLIRSAVHNERKKGFRKLKQHKDDVIKAELIEAMKFDDPAMKHSRAIRIHACMTLIQYGMLMIEPLCYVLSHEKSVEARANALWCLWDIGVINDMIINLIGDSLKDPNEIIRFQAALAVGYLRLEEYASNLKDLMLTDPELEVRWKAAWALGILRVKKYDKDVISAINDPKNQDKKIWFIYSLTKIEGKGETGESLIIDMIAKGKATAEDFIYLQSIYYEMGLFDRLVVLDKSITQYDKEFNSTIRDLEKKNTDKDLIKALKISYKKDKASFKKQIAEILKESWNIGYSPSKNKIKEWFSGISNIILLIYTIAATIGLIIGWIV